MRINTKPSLLCLVFASSILIWNVPSALFGYYVYRPAGYYLLGTNARVVAAFFIFAASYVLRDYIFHFPRDIRRTAAFAVLTPLTVVVLFSIFMNLEGIQRINGVFVLLPVFVIFGGIHRYLMGLRE